MTADNILEIGIDELGRLYVKPEKAQFNLVWRTATEVHWDDNGRFLYTPKPREWSYFEWYKHIIEVIYSECRYELITAPETTWTNISDEVKGQITTYRERATKVNFMIEEGYAVVYDGYHIDLHNNFTLEDCNYDNDTKELLLKFKKGTGDWIPDDGINDVLLTHKGVSFINIARGADDNSSPFQTGIEDLCYYPSSQRDVNDNITVQAFPENGDDIIYSFSNGLLVRAGCEEIVLSV